MKILQIELSADEQTAIFNELTKRFNTEDAKQTIEVELCNIPNFLTLENDDLLIGDREFSLESILELYTEYPEPDENNQTAISHRSVSKFRITFFYDGEEIQVNSDPIYEAINKYYEI